MALCGTKLLRERWGSPGRPWTNGWRIRRDVSARRLRCRRNLAGAPIVEHLSYYYSDRGSKTARAYYSRVLYRAWGLTTHQGRARLILDRRGLVHAPNAPRPQGTKANTPVLVTCTTRDRSR